MRTLLVDDHALFRDGVASLLLAWGHEVVGQASDGGEAIELVDSTSPDVVLMDVRMPNVSGLEATAEIKARHPEVAIVMLTVSEEEADLFRAIKAGAQGYLLKNLEAPQLRSMLEGVARGEPAITPATAARIIDEFLRRPGSAPRPVPAADGSRARGPAAGHRRPAQPRDRGRARDQREHRQVPPQEHRREAPRPEPRRAGRPRRARGARAGHVRHGGVEGPRRDAPFRRTPR